MRQNNSKKRLEQAEKREMNDARSEMSWPPYPPAAGLAVSQEEIRTLAYHKWRNAGMPPGDGKQFWFEAEQELRRGSDAPRF
jgi:hypothetical protein